MIGRRTSLRSWQPRPYHRQASGLEVVLYPCGRRRCPSIPIPATNCALPKATKLCLSLQQTSQPCRSRRFLPFIIFLYDMTYECNCRIWAKYYEFSSLAFLIYDILLTLSSEVHVIWKRKFSALTVLWTLVRHDSLPCL